MDDDSSDTANNGFVRCGDCPQQPHCVPAELTGAALLAFESAMVPLPDLTQGQALVESGDAFDALFAVKVGALKAVRCDADGVEIVTDFCLSGSVVGLAEQGLSCWRTTHVALEDSCVCRIPLQALDGLEQRLIELVSERLSKLYATHHCMAHGSASQRLSMLLVRLGGANHSQRFRLPMSDGDMASYLGIGEDDIDMAFQLLRACGWITERDREIDIRDLSGLQRHSRV